MKKENVAIIGASDKPDRYSYKAFQLLKQYGHNPIPVNPKLSELDGKKCYPNFLEVKKDIPEIDTLTVYINPEISSKMLNEIIILAPKRVIFNPGSENPNLYKELDEKGIKSEEACTLVLLKTGQY